jgi:hypothetical protein
MVERHALCDSSSGCGPERAMAGSLTLEASQALPDRSGRMKSSLQKTRTKAGDCGVIDIIG